MRRKRAVFDHALVDGADLDGGLCLGAFRHDRDGIVIDVIRDHIYLFVRKALFLHIITHGDDRPLRKGVFDGIRFVAFGKSVDDLLWGESLFIEHRRRLDILYVAFAALVKNERAVLIRDRQLIDVLFVTFTQDVEQVDDDQVQLRILLHIHFINDDVIGRFVDRERFAVHVEDLAARRVGYHDMRGRRRGEFFILFAVDDLPVKQPHRKTRENDQKDDDTDDAADQGIVFLFFFLRRCIRRVQQAAAVSGKDSFRVLLQFVARLAILVHLCNPPFFK